MKREILVFSFTLLMLIGVAACIEPVAVVDDPSPDPLTVIAVSASSDDGNAPENTLDGDLSTRWSAQGAGQFIEFGFNESVRLDSIGIAWYSGDERYSTYEVLTSLDGTGWTSRISRTTDVLTIDHQTDVIDADARFVRIVGYGNSLSSWNSITSVRFNDQAPSYVPSLAADEPSLPDGDQLIDLSAFATVHDGPFNLVHDRRASGGTAVFAPWMYETLGGSYPSSETLDLTFDPVSADVSVWIRIYSQRMDAAGWRFELPNGNSRTIRPDLIHEYVWVEAYRGPLENSQASLRPLGSRSSVDVVLITESRDPSKFDALLDFPTPGLVPQANYFVSVTGSDSASGSASDPFRTIQKAVDEATAGDTILVREGMYAGFRVYRKSGSQDSPITVMAYPGERVILDAHMTSRTDGVISIDNPSSYWVFDGFEITDRNPRLDEVRALDIRKQEDYERYLELKSELSPRWLYGVRMTSHPDREKNEHLIFRNFEIHDMPRHGFSGSGRYLAYTNNHVHNIGYPRSGYAWYSGGESFHWEGNIVHDAVRAIQARTARAPWPQDMLIEKNLFYRTGRFTWEHSGNDVKGPALAMVFIADGGIGGANAVYNNIILYTGDGHQDQTPGGDIAHNSFIGIGVGSNTEALTLRDDGAVVTNNVFIENLRDIIDEGSGSVLVSNIETSEAVYRDPYALDFTVVSSSPTIDTGVSFPDLTYDFYGTPRPQGSGWDIGAIER